MIRLLLDQGLPQATSAILRARGYDAIHVEELGMSEAEDESIVLYAVQSGYTIVTLDSDFHTLIAVTGRSQPSTIRFRIQRMRASEASLRIESVVKRLQVQLESGCLVTVDRRTTRVRGLPIIT